MSLPTHLLWCDLETTGTDEQRDCIIEIGCVLTTPDLTEIAEFHTLVAPTAEGLGRLYLNPVVRKMHMNNGLLAELDDGEHSQAHVVDVTITSWLVRSGVGKVRPMLAGSGVSHFDRRFIRRWLPMLDARLAYPMLDIGVIRRAHAMWVGTEVSTAYESKTHRAMDDIRCHLAEAAAYRDLWRGMANHAE